MWRIVFSAALACAAFIAQPAAADEIYVVTPSGASESYFDMPVVQTSDLLANKCIDLHWTVVSSTETVVTCEAPMNFGQSLLASMLIGNQYSTPPKLYYRFNLAGSGASTRVQASGWVETQMAFGQVRQEPLTGAPFHNSVMDFFEAAGGRWPPGTTFPNHAYIGLSFTAAGGDPHVAQISKVDTGSAAEKAGLQIGDIVTRIAGKKIKDRGDVLDALAKAHETATYQVEYSRNGKKATATLTREFRTAIAEPAHLPLPAASPAVAVVNSPAAQSSVADELAKFAKLRADGVITDAEFQAEKTKLLAQ